VSFFADPPPPPEVLEANGRYGPALEWRSVSVAGNLLSVSFDAQDGGVQRLRLSYTDAIALAAALKKAARKS
jgi:hypothetical protein